MKWPGLRATLALSILTNIALHAQTGATAQAAGVLFNLHETVAYTKSPFLLRTNTIDLIDDGENSLQLPFVELTGGLAVLGQSTAIDVKKKYTGFLVGTSNFAGPQGLGLVGSRKSYIGIIEDGSQPNLDEDFKAANLMAVSGRNVWSWSAPPYEGHPDVTPFFAGQVGTSYFLMTNSLQDFTQLAVALSSSKTGAAEDPTVFSWEKFSKQDYWAYRLFRRGETVTAASGLSFLTQDHLALAFYANLETRKSVIRILAKDKGMSEVPKVLPDIELKRFRRADAGVWEGSIPITQDAAGIECMARLFYTFGFGIYL